LASGETLKHKGQENMSDDNLRDQGSDRDRLWRWDDLMRFQHNIAERWLERGNKVKDIFSKFFFYFSGFNALYFLWRKIDELHNSNEGEQIEHLLSKLDDHKAQEILDEIRPAIQFFIDHRPIQRMDKRDVGSPYEGEAAEGRKWRRKLKDDRASAANKINAIGQIVYLIRSNLVHGSKAGSGDDLEIIKNAVEPLRILLEQTLSWSKQQCPWER
jgi:hypothetical protein